MSKCSDKKGAGNAGKNKPATDVKKTKEDCPKIEYELVELVEVVTQDKEKWVKGAAMDATDTTVITKSVERTAATKDGANFKQYINLGKDFEGAGNRHPEYGREITCKARVKQKNGKTDKLAGVKVNFSHKRTDGPNRSGAEIWSGADLTGNQKEGFGSAGGTATTSGQTDANGWTAQVLFFLSQYGGDQFEISAVLDPVTPGATGASPVKTKAKYVVWRKFWYQMTSADGYNPPTPSKAEEAYAKVFAEMVKAGEKKFKKEDMPVGLRDRTILKEYMLKQGGANKDVAAIGAHNKNEFKKDPIYISEPDKYPIKAHLIICEYQCDPKTNAGNPAYTGLGKFVLTKNGQEVTLPQGSGGPIVCKPGLREGTNLVITGEWSKKLVPWLKGGDITDANIDIDPGRADTLSVKIDLSRGGIGAPVPSSSQMVYVKLQLDTAEDFLGESFGKGQILCVYRPAAAAGTQGSAEDYNDTVAHELGHMWNQTPVPTKQPESLKDHPLQYVGHGGTGSHCRDGAKKSNTAGDATASQNASTTITKTAAATDTHEVASTAGFIGGHKVTVNGVEREVDGGDATHLHFTTRFAANKDEAVQQKLTYGPVNWNDATQEYPSPGGGTCLMYHSYCEDCSHDFCKTCKPYLQLQEMSSI